ncbi:MAG: right-handed parallel beta-helix repeat-containing protein [Nanoarchaeota archaeon]
MKIAADDITVDGFKINIIKDKEETKYAIQINSDTKGIIINNCDFNGLQFQNNITKVTLENNIIRDTLYEGIYIGETNSEIKILNNEFYDNSRDLEELGEVGFYSIAVHEGSSNILLENNHIRDNYARGIRLIEAEAEIKNNKIKNNEYAGIYLEQNSSATIENKLIESNQTYGIAIDSDSKAEIYHNEIFDNKSINLLLFSETTAAETVINNNNIYYNTLNKSSSLAIKKIENDETNYTDNQLNTKNNWWGVNNLKEAADSEYNIVNDAGDTVLEGNVDYLPFKSAKIEEAGI